MARKWSNSNPNSIYFQFDERKKKETELATWITSMFVALGHASMSTETEALNDGGIIFSDVWAKSCQALVSALSPELYDIVHSIHRVKKPVDDRCTNSGRQICILREVTTLETERSVRCAFANCVLEWYVRIWIEDITFTFAILSELKRISLVPVWMTKLNTKTKGKLNRRDSERERFGNVSLIIVRLQSDFIKYIEREKIEIK